MGKLRIYGPLAGGAALAVTASSLGATNHYRSSAEVSEAEKVAPAKISYNWDVAPILLNNCFRCHGNDAGKRKAGLRLDTAANAYAPVPEHKAHRAIVPHNPGASELIRRIVSSDPDVRMPPKETRRVLSPAEIATLTRWIEQGAEYEELWSYIPPKTAAPQHAEFDKQAVNDIDRHIYARLQKAAVRPSPEADRETLINRVTLDLTGLPPTLQEVDAFLADEDPNAYEHLVGRLLASPAYGARHSAAVRKSRADASRKIASSGKLSGTRANAGRLARAAPRLLGREI